LDYNEEAYPDGPVADIPVAMMPNSGKITLLQMDGLVSKEQLMELWYLLKLQVKLQFLQQLKLQVTRQLIWLWK
jgi:ribonuclease PH